MNLLQMGSLQDKRLLKLWQPRIVRNMHTYERMIASIAKRNMQYTAT